MLRTMVKKNYPLDIDLFREYITFIGLREKNVNKLGYRHILKKLSHTLKFIPPPTTYKIFSFYLFFFKISTTLPFYFSFSKMMNLNPTLVSWINFRKDIR